MSNKLTSKQEAFCREYMIDLNGAQAAIRAGYSERSAKEVASENLTKPNIQKRIAELIEKRNERLDLSADSVVRRYIDIADLDLADFYDDQWNPKKPSELTPKQRKFLNSVTPTRSGVKFDMIDKAKALESLARHLGVYEEDNKQRSAQPLEVIFRKMDDKDGS